MTVGHRWTAVAAGSLALVGLLAGCGKEHVTQQTGTAPVTAVSTALRDVRGGTCPAGPPARPAGDAPGMTKALEPLAANRVLLCQYGSQTRAQVPARLSAHALVTDPGTVRSLRASLAALGPVRKGSYNCPRDTGARVLAIFTDGTRAVELTDRISGCATVTNGSYTRWVGTSGVNDSVRRLLRRP
jgi:hypothetical protein